MSVKLVLFLVRNVCLHDAKNTKSWAYPNPELVGERFNAPEKIYCILDMDEGTKLSVV
jgi:hypothetical protein